MVGTWRYDGIGSSSRDGGMTALSVMNTVGGDTADRLLRRDLRQQIGQNRRIPDTVSGHLDGSHLERVSINTDMDLSPLATGAGPVLAYEPDQKTIQWIVFPANGPLAFARELDTVSPWP